ncbi:5350_t:CDS:1, partial [Funneliformis caledonium]
LEHVNNEDENKYEKYENLELSVIDIKLNDAVSEVIRLLKLDESLKIFDNE